MKINTLHFGKIEIKEQDIINFEKGILAFDHLHKFIMIDVAENPAFKWLQSIEDEAISFLLVDPFLINPDYSVHLNDTIRTELEITKEEDVLIYTTVAVPENGFKDATTNLIGPIILNIAKHKGKQLVLENKELTVKYPLFPKTQAQKVCGG